MKSVFLILVLVVVVGVVNSRHIHPGHTSRRHNQEPLLDEVYVQNVMPLDVIRRLKPGFVPINHPAYFNHEPCEDGFKRDLRGICREVWD